MIRCDALCALPLELPREVAVTVGDLLANAAAAAPYLGVGLLGVVAVVCGLVAFAIERDG